MHRASNVAIDDLSATVTVIAEISDLTHMLLLMLFVLPLAYQHVALYVSPLQVPSETVSAVCTPTKMRLQRWRKLFDEGWIDADEFDQYKNKFLADPSELLSVLEETAAMTVDGDTDKQDFLEVKRNVFAKLR